MMTKEDIRIVFMGTPEFAVASLQALVEAQFNIVGVITMPDKPAGRGYKLHPSPVKTYALSQGLKVLQPENLKSETFLSELKALRADLQIVVAFRMLPEIVWDMPRLGTFNLHSSLLPQYRGAAPINWAIINGDTKSGVTTFFLSHEIDTGRIIFQEETPISDNDTAETLHDRLMTMGADLVTKTVNGILTNTINPTPQEEIVTDEETLRPAPKIFKETCRIDWTKPNEEIRNFVRGLSPYPAAWTCFEQDNKLSMKVFSCELVSMNNTADKKPGSIISDNKSYIYVATGKGAISITELQLSGKKRMKVRDFLNGFEISGFTFQ